MTAVIQQNNGAGLLTCGMLLIKLLNSFIIIDKIKKACGYQDSNTDGSISVWKDINDITVICTLFAFLI